MPIIVKSKIEGYRRAGMAHSKAPVTHPDGTFSEAQIAQLKADPRITVTLEPTADSPDSSSSDSGSMDSQRLAELVAHIAQLDKEDESLWTEGGAPKTSAMPSGTNAAERDAAWGAFVAQLDAEG